MRLDWSPEGDGAGLLEAMHRPDLPDTDWLDGMWQAATALVPHATGVMAGIASWQPGVDGLRMECVRATMPSQAERAMHGPETVDATALQRLYAREDRVSTLRGRFPVGKEPSEMTQLARDLGFSDFLNVQCAQPRADGRVSSTVVCALSSSRVVLSRPARAAWEQFAAHLSAAARLRRFGPRSSAEAVLSPDGSVLHAEGGAREVDAREALRRAVIAIDRARRTECRTDIGGLLDAWRAIYEGRWTLVETFENDGKRLLLARVNPPAEPPPDDALTPRERQVAALLAEGASQVGIAYELNVSTSAVAGHLRRIARKVGASRSTDAVRKLVRGAPPPRG